MNLTRPHFKRPEWIFFDLDDTLWDFSQNSLKSLLFVYSSFSEINSLFPTFEAFVTVYHKHNSDLWHSFALGEVSSDFLKTERWRLTLYPASDPDNPPAPCHTINDAYLSRLSSLPFPVDGALQLLEELSHDFIIAGISNGFNDTQYRKLFNSGLWRYVTRLIISDEIGINKPNPKIFKYALDETGATGLPLMVGDNADTDIIGALKAGWKAIWFNRDHSAFPYSSDQLKALGINPTLFLGTARDIQEVGRLIRKSILR